VTFYVFWAQKTHRKTSKIKRLLWKNSLEDIQKLNVYFGLGILLPIKIQSLDIENKKIGALYCTLGPDQVYFSI
jgi:hypothetical protein